LEQLLLRNLAVRVLVRSAQRLPASSLENPNLTVIKADLLSLGDEDLQRHVQGCDAVISCLGHTLSIKGVFGPPRDLVRDAVKKVCRAIEAVRPAIPIKFILMSSVSVNRLEPLDTRRGGLERACVAMIRGLVPPARDNQRAADFLAQGIGAEHRCIQWVIVRPDTLLNGGITEYALHEGLVSSLFQPASTNMANVAHFMCELVANPEAWAAWKGKLPVIVNTGGTA